MQAVASEHSELRNTIVQKDTHHLMMELCLPAAACHFGGGEFSMIQLAAFEHDEVRNTCMHC